MQRIWIPVHDDSIIYFVNCMRSIVRNSLFRYSNFQVNFEDIIGGFQVFNLEWTEYSFFLDLSDSATYDELGENGSFV